jgi:hypothetical protein
MPLLLLPHRVLMKTHPRPKVVAELRPCGVVFDGLRWH